MLKRCGLEYEDDMLELSQLSLLGKKIECRISKMVYVELILYLFKSIFTYYEILIFDTLCLSLGSRFELFEISDEITNRLLD